MSEMNNIWPTEEELINSNGKVDLAPYGVISEYSDMLFEAYNKKLIGIILAKSRISSNGDKTDFVYSLVLAQAKIEGVQIKIFEIDIEDDGWYPAKVNLTKPYRDELGVAQNEAQLRTFIEQGIKSDFVKRQIQLLLKD